MFRVASWRSGTMMAYGIGCNDDDPRISQARVSHARMVPAINMIGEGCSVFFILLSYCSLSLACRPPLFFKFIPLATALPNPRYPSIGKFLILHCVWTLLVQIFVILALQLYAVSVRMPLVWIFLDGC